MSSPTSTSIPTGHLGNLTAQQQTSLYQLWILLYNFLDKKPFTFTETTRKELESSDIHTSLFGELLCAMCKEHPDTLLLRFLRARNWNVDNAFKMLSNTIQWRVDFGVRKIVEQGEYGLNLKIISSGRNYMRGCDKDGRPICYIHVRFHDKSIQTDEEMQKFIVWAMESGRLFLSKGVEAVTLVFDMTDFSMANMNHYPESLGKAFIMNAPMLFSGIWKLIRPLLDPVVAAKIVFVKKAEEMNEFIPLEQVPKRAGGPNEEEFEYIMPEEQVDVDEEEKKRATEVFKKAAIDFDILTRQVCHLYGNGAGEEEIAAFLKEREDKREGMSQAFTAFDKVTRARTVYHRNGQLI